MNNNETDQTTGDMNKTRPEAYSLSGTALYAIDFPEEVKTRYLSNLDEAEERFRNNPDDEDALVWYGRRLGYLTRYQEAIKVFSDGLARFPSSHILLRHRGHRYISIRKFENAVEDFARADELSTGLPDELERDGEPNKAGIPLSTVRFNILYHLGLSYYLQGDFESALPVYQRCMEYSRNNADSLVATTDWLYMTLRRLGRHDEAEKLLEPISADMEIIENEAYFHRLLMYKGEKTPEDLLGAPSTAHHDTATHGYGIGNWHLCSGRKDKAVEVFKMVIDSGFWPAFGFIAAEADLFRPGALD